MASNICLNCKRALSCPWVMRAIPRPTVWTEYRPSEIPRGRLIIKSYEVRECKEYDPFTTYRMLAEEISEKLNVSYRTARTYVGTRIYRRTLWNRCQSTGNEKLWEKICKYKGWIFRD